VTVPTGQDLAAPAAVPVTDGRAGSRVGTPVVSACMALASAARSQDLELTYRLPRAELQRP
jgi:hypothetical protein